MNHAGVGSTVSLWRAALVGVGSVLTIALARSSLPPPADVYRPKLAVSETVQPFLPRHSSPPADDASLEVRRASSLPDELALDRRSFGAELRRLVAGLREVTV